MGGRKKHNKSVHTTTTRTVIMCSNGSPLFFLATALLIATLPVVEAGTACSFNGNGTCIVGTDTAGYLEELTANNNSVQWKIRPQNIGFMYYLRTSNDGNDLDVRGIVKWKVQLKNWTPNDTSVEGFLVTIYDHDTNETLKSFKISVTEPFEEFVKENEVMELRMDLQDVLHFNRRYDAKINLLPIGKQAAASSFLSIMGKLDEEPCSEKKGLAERWAPHVMVDVFEATKEVELSWQPAPALLCVKTYEIVLQNRDGDILNTSEIEVSPGQKLANVSFGRIPKNKVFQLKVRAKNASDDGCACVNCNCITDKSRYFVMPDLVKTTPNMATTPIPLQETPESVTGIPIFSIIIVLLTIAGVTFLCAFVCCRKRYATQILKQKVAFDILTTPEITKRKIHRKCSKILLVCPNATGREYDLMVRISEALKGSKNDVVCDRWKECFSEAEQNMFHWIDEQTKIAEQIIVIHSSDQGDETRKLFGMVILFAEINKKPLVHIALTPKIQRKFEVQYVMPRDQKHLEAAYDITIAEPLVIDIPRSIVIDETKFASCDSVQDGSSPDSTKTHSTDSGVSSMSSNNLGSDEGLTETMNTVIEVHGTKHNIETHPLLLQTIPA